MGSTRWDPNDWQQHTTKTANQTQQQIFKQNSVQAIHEDLDPRKIKVRESVGSAANPNPTPIVLAVDQTGSMGILAEMIIKKDLGVVMEQIYDRDPVPDPHIMCMAVGDAISDQAPLQVTQFEADIVIAKQVENFYLEGNGGGNHGESYILAWYFAAFKTRCEAIVKGRKGYLFTIGDEAPHPVLTREQIKRVIGDDVERDMEIKDLLGVLSQHWEVFHIIVQPHYPEAITKWQALLGERAILVDNHENMGEVIVSTIQIIEGADHAKVAASWNGNTAVAVREATKGLVKGGQPGSVRV